MTMTREARREALRNEYKDKQLALRQTVHAGSIEEIRAAVNDTILAYLRHAKWQPYTLTKDTEVECHGTGVGGHVRITIPAGAKGWINVEKHPRYDKYVWVNDEQYPAKDAKMVGLKTYYTWCCLVRDENGLHLAETMKVVG